LISSLPPQNYKECPKLPYNLFSIFTLCKFATFVQAMCRPTCTAVGFWVLICIVIDFGRQGTLSPSSKKIKRCRLQNWSFKEETLHIYKTQISSSATGNLQVKKRIWNSKFRGKTRLEHSPNTEIN